MTASQHTSSDYSRRTAEIVDISHSNWKTCKTLHSVGRFYWTSRQKRAFITLS